MATRWSLAQVPWWEHHQWMMGWHWGWGIFWLVVLALLAWGVARSLGPERPRGPGDRPSAEAERALRRRFADGELSEEEYRARLRVLRESE